MMPVLYLWVLAGLLAQSHGFGKCVGQNKIVCSSLTSKHGNFTLVQMNLCNIHRGGYFFSQWIFMHHFCILQKMNTSEASRNSQNFNIEKGLMFYSKRSSWENPRRNSLTNDWEKTFQQYSEVPPQCEVIFLFVLGPCQSYRSLWQQKQLSVLFLAALAEKYLH